MKKYSALVLALLGSFSAMSHAETVLKFGVDPSFPPFESKAADGTLVGF
ncbi:lysine-arginine-ornithine-binding periplasmic protein [Ewingella americana]|nr:lysine-arginine-ornithine-binding periplasmic protein [Ewingella americana]